MRVRAGRDDARGRRLAQPVEQELREQERRELVDGEGGLEAVDRERPAAAEESGVVNEHVDLGVPLAQLAGEPSHFGQVGEVRAQRLCRICRVDRSEALPDRLEPSPVAADRHHGRAHRGELDCRCGADPGAGSGHDDHPAGERGLGHVRLDAGSAAASGALAGAARPPTRTVAGQRVRRGQSCWRARSRPRARAA